jgi:uncharacterized membrane protein YkvA (DUF1232 family)
MTPKPTLLETLIDTRHSDAAQFGQVSPNAWRISGKTMTIDEYIENQRKGINSTDLRVLRTFAGRLLDKLKESNAREHPGLSEAVHVLVQVLESPSVQRAKDPLPAWLAEVAFAAGYLLKRFDLIPDHVAEIGLVDDALILQRVVERNRSALDRSFAEENRLDAT